VVLAFYISDDKAYQEYRSVNNLFYHIFHWAVEHNFQFFDFGIFTVNMDPNWGLGKFKESFGARGLFRDTFELIL
jgi:lipid II:glycine glycyltransferase (peptidoglycan interpeptide bridge formation enzyme)